MSTLKYWISLMVMTYAYSKLSDVSGELYFVCLSLVTLVYMAAGSYSEKVISFKMPFGKSNGNTKGSGRQ